jgi:hypothetical protein
MKNLNSAYVYTVYIYIHIYVILTFYKGKVATHFAGAFFRIHIHIYVYIYIRETSIYDKRSSQIEIGLYFFLS